ncbi:MAG: UDP-3-O-(3-hydroxymyristoyl)glucosamine N-acyltransferase [Planctomycetota bacterium]|jgi:UDP-3-O-[3-hydroxymyristoyl] glucosamine N-acyltransferase
MESKKLSELAEYVGGKVKGDANIIIKSASTLNRAGAGDISFLANPRYTKQLQTTKASAVIVDKERDDMKVPQLISEDPYYAFMQIMVLLHGHRQHKKVGVSKKASIADTAKIGSGCDIHDFAVISDDTIVGNNCTVYPNAYIGEGVQIGDDCIIYANAVIYDGCKLGNRVIINANATIGEDGFGYASYKGVHHKIPQTGIVVLENDVEIGAGCGIERGTLGDTVIGTGTKIGDVVAIGHGAKIGAHCLLVAQVGVAGSTNIGNHCIIGGQAGIVGHINIGNNVMIGAQAGVINDIPDKKIVIGAPAIEARQAKRAYSMIRNLPEMRQNIRNLTGEVNKLCKMLEIKDDKKEEQKEK